jgi:hypothetical protein
MGREAILRAKKLTENVCDYSALEAGLLRATLTAFFLDCSGGGMGNQTPAWIFRGQLSFLK